MWAAVFLIIIAYLCYLIYKDEKVIKQNAYIATFWSQLLYFLTEQKKYKEKDYLRIITAIWELDSNLLATQEFNPKWEKILTAFKIPVIYDDKYNTTIKEDSIPILASKLYNERHTFQQYAEQSERSRRITEEIWNDPKYRY